MSDSVKPCAVQRRWREAAWRQCHLLACFLLIGLLAILGQSTAGAASGTQAPLYLIGPGDTLEITVWRQAELSTSVTVRPDGRISVPLVEDLMAAGKTTRDLASDLTERLSVYVRDPMVTVTVAGGLGDLGQQVRVLGEAARPQALPFRSGMTLLDAVIATGGLSRQADGNAAVIIRRTETGTREVPVRLADLVRDGDVSANVPLQPGDVIFVPEGFLQGEWRVAYSASASETFSDNIDQGSDGDRESALISRAGPSISITGNTARVTAGLDASLDGVHQFGGDDEGVSLDPRINGTSTTEVSPDLLFFDLRTSISRQLLNSRQSSSASGASTSNRDIVATLTASPFLLHRLGDFADVEWRYSFSPVLVDSDDNSDGISHDGSLILDSGSNFSFFGWTWTNSVGEELRDGEADIRTASTDLGVSYQLWKGFSLIGGVGYEFRDGDSDDDNNFDGLTWRGGFDWAPHPDFNLEATFGRRDDNDSLDASLDYQVGPKTSLTASYSESLETSQQRSISNLANLSIDPDTGEIIDDVTGEPFAGNLDPFTFDDETTRTRTFRLNARHESGRNSFGLSGLAGTSEGGSTGEEAFYTGSVSWGRTLSPELQLTTGASYQHSAFDEDDRTDDTYSANVGFNYTLTSNARASLNYSFQLRDSSEQDQDYYENAVTLGIAISF